MTQESRPILEYAIPAVARPRRWWLPVVFLSVAFVTWNWPRLTPTFFPNDVDLAMLVLLAAGALGMTRSSSLPGWAFVAYGAGAVLLFLLANFGDRNFRSNTSISDILLPWCAMVALGGVVSRAIAFFGRARAKRARTPREGVPL